MAETPTKPGSTPAAPQKKSVSKGAIILIILLIIAIVGILIWFLPKKAEYTALIKEKEQEKVELQSELNNLLAEHESIKAKYGELSDSLAVKDSIIQANAAEIKQLLNYKWEYRKVNKKLTLLRKITQGYVHQLDSLYTVNRDLKEENEKIRQQYSQEQERTRILAKDKEQLIEKVSEASVLKAYNVTATGIRYTGSGREKTTDKAKKVEKIKVCFTIGENKLAKPGIHAIYMQIIRPDNVTVTQKIDGPYTFEFNGQQIEYTTKKEIQYKNEDTDLCLFWAKKNKTEPAMVGMYKVRIFSDGYEIGQAAFELR
jgi:hypothetical protein